MSVSFMTNLPVSQALITELLQCSMDSVGKLQLLLLAESVALSPWERSELIEHIGGNRVIAEVRFVHPRFQPAAWRCLRRLKSDDNTVRVPLPEAFVGVYAGLPYLRGEEFHLLQFLQRVRVEGGHHHICGALKERLPHMKDNRDMAEGLIQRFDQ